MFAPRADPHPIGRANRRTEPRLQAFTARYDLSALKVAIVDDHNSIRTMYTALLKAFGMRAVTTFSHPDLACEALRTYPPDMMFLDWDMGPPDGLEVLKWIRRSGECADPGLPVIMLTGYGDVDRVKAARDAGANSYLVKPVSAKALYTRIAGVIEDRRSFVRTGAYFGPDRRWREQALNEDERRSSPVPSP